MPSICLGCGVTTDANGRLTLDLGCGLTCDSATGQVAVDLAELGMEIAQGGGRLAVDPTPLPAAGGEVVVAEHQATITNRAECVTKQLYVAYSSDVPIHLGDGTRVQKLTEHSIDGGGTWSAAIGPILQFQGCEYGGPPGSFGSWFDTCPAFPQGTLAPGQVLQVLLRTRLVVLADARNGGAYANPQESIQLQAWPVA
jgi:hypothetical protein